MSEEAKTEASTRNGAHRPHLVEYEIRSRSQSPVISDPNEEDDIQVVYEHEALISRRVGVIVKAGSKSTDTTPKFKNESVPNSVFTSSGISDDDPPADTTPKFQNEPVPNLVFTSSGISDNHPPADPRTVRNPTRNSELMELKVLNWKVEVETSSSSRRRSRNLDGARMARALAKYMNPVNPFPSQTTSIKLTVQVAAEKDAIPSRLQTCTREKSAEDNLETGTHKKNYSPQHPFEREGHQNDHQQHVPFRQNSNGSISMPNPEPRGCRLERGSAKSERSPVSGPSRRNDEDSIWRHRNWNYRRSNNHHYPSTSRDSRPSKYYKIPNYQGGNVFHPCKINQNSSNRRWGRRDAPAPQRSLFPLTQNFVASGTCSATASQNEANPRIIEPQSTHRVDNSPGGWLCPQCNIRYKTKSYRNRHKYTLKCKQIAELLLKASTGSNSGN